MDSTSDAIRDLAIIELQEELLQFTAFDNTTAWQLGESIKKHCESRSLAVTIEIRMCRETVFFFAMPGTSPNNSDWARRKRNTTELQQRSSYAVGLALPEGETLERQTGLPLRDFAHHEAVFRYGSRVWAAWAPQRSRGCRSAKTTISWCSLWRTSWA